MQVNAPPCKTHKVANPAAPISYKRNPMSEKAAETKENLGGKFTEISFPAHSFDVSLILSQII
jgi:hypothetical protein